MKNLAGLRIVTMILLLFVTGSNAQNPQTSPKTKLEVIYFHATMRCATCNAVEDNARKLLEKSYKSQLDNGTIKFNSYNVDESANKALMEKYQISFSTLLLVSADGSKTDFTAKAFQYALTNPLKYESLLNEAIQAKLK